MKKHCSVIICLFISTSFPIHCFCQQSVTKAKSDILGTWRLNDDGVIYVFSSRTVREYIDGKLENKYSYVIQGPNSKCGQNWVANSPAKGDSDLVVIEFHDLETGENDCAQINGVSKKYLSIQYARDPRPTLFVRIKPKTAHR